MPEERFWEFVECRVDEDLSRFGYALEAAIDHYQSLCLDEHFDLYGTCKECGYMPPFCLCKGMPIPGVGSHLRKNESDLLELIAAMIIYN